MITLGVSEEHDSGVALIENGRIIFAANEERFNRKKHSGGFPAKSLQQAMKFLHEQGKQEQIDHIAIASLNHVHQGAPDSYDPKQKAQRSFLITIIRQVAKFRLGNWIMNSRLFAILLKRAILVMQTGRKKRLLQQIADVTDINTMAVKSDMVDHHLCHAYSTYFTAGFNDALVLTFDAQGDGICSRIFQVSDGRFKELKFQPFFVSVGYYYVIVTVILGFKGGQEGKVTGLSACGNAEKTYPILKQRLSYHSEKLSFNCNGLFYLDEIDYLKQQLADYSREDIAAGIQHLLEEYICAYVTDIMTHFNLPKSDLCVAGGIFANVLLNNKLAQIDLIDQIFVHPNMGDGGLATGAAFSLANKYTDKLTPYQMQSAYLGNEYSSQYIQTLLDEQGIKYTKEAQPEETVGKLLSQDNIVCLYQGRMEYGPRALGNRSIMAQAKDMNMNDRLNTKLCRSEFMPFAPSVLEEQAHDYFDLDNSSLLACEFMTMVVNCTSLCKDKAPAIVHVDGTARPHIVRQSINPRYHKIIHALFEITGVPLILNTSFNMHDEPIVESPETALNSFQRSSIDYMLIGPYLISRKDNFE